jgi:hypothetical protein
MKDGTIVLVVDGRDTLWMSRDEQLTWSNPGGDIKGIHAGVVELKNGDIMAFSRGGGEAYETLPKSISSDGGKTFTYEETELHQIAGNQRLALLRLKEGPLFYAGFADTGIMITDASGTEREIHGLYTAISLDEGKTWPYKRIVSDDGPGKIAECMSGGLFVMSGSNAEYKGYLSVCQSADGLVHLISSQQHYAFNLKWLMTASPALRYPEVPLQPVVETFSGPDKFDADGWVPYHSYIGKFTGHGSYSITSLSHLNGINRIVGKGSFEINAKIDNIHYYDPGPRVSEGMAIRIFNNRARVLHFALKQNAILLDYNDLEPDEKSAKPERPGEWLHKGLVKLDSPPKSAKVRLIWNEDKKTMRVFYGINGAEPTEELPFDKKGVYFGRPLTESTSVYLLMSNGTMELDHFEIKAL